MTGLRGEGGEKGDTGLSGSDHIGGLALVILILVSGFSILAFGVHKSNVASGEARMAAAQAKSAAFAAHAASVAANKGLCTLYVGDLKRAQDTRDFLTTHPKGAPSLGLTRAVLERSISLLVQQAKNVNPGDCRVPDRLKRFKT